MSWYLWLASALAAYTVLLVWHYIFLTWLLCRPPEGMCQVHRDVRRFVLILWTHRPAWALASFCLEAAVMPMMAVEYKLCSRRGASRSFWWAGARSCRRCRRAGVPYPGASATAKHPAR